MSTKGGTDIYMLVEKEYPLSTHALTVMLSVKLTVEEDTEMAKELVRKIFLHCKRYVWK